MTPLYEPIQGRSNTSKVVREEVRIDSRLLLETQRERDPGNHRLRPFSRLPRRHGSESRKKINVRFWLDFGSFFLQDLWGNVWEKVHFPGIRIGRELWLEERNWYYPSRLAQIVREITDNGLITGDNYNMNNARWPPPLPGKQDILYRTHYI